MTTRKIIKKAVIANIEEAGYKVDKIVKGKGLKVICEDETFMSVVNKYKSSNQIMKYLEKKAKYFNIKLDELHVTTLSIDGKYYIKDSEHSMSIEDFKKINISGHQKVYLKISRKPYLVGYIPLNEFEDASYYEMRATC